MVFTCVTPIPTLFFRSYFGTLHHERESVRGCLLNAKNIKILKDICSKTYEDDIGLNITYLTTLKQEIHRAVNEPRSYTHRTNVC